MSSVQLMKLTTHLILTLPPALLPSCAVRLYGPDDFFFSCRFFAGH